MSQLDYALQDTWRDELATIENLHPDIKEFGFRASCVRNWALQHDYQLPGVKSSIRPSKRQIASILNRLGYNVENKAFRYGTERIYYKSKDAENWGVTAAKIKDIYLFIRGEWILERDVEARNFASPFGENLKLDLLGSVLDRQRDAELWAQGQITEKRAEDLKQKLIEREYSRHLEREGMREKEADAADKIRAALVKESHSWNINDPERFNYELELALKRWRKAVVLDDYLVRWEPELALKPKSRLDEKLKIYADNQRLKLSAKDEERGGSDYGFKWS